MVVFQMRTSATIEPEPETGTFMTCGVSMFSDCPDIAHAEERESLIDPENNDVDQDRKFDKHLSNMHPPNFHSWVIVTATEPHTSLASGVTRLLFSILVILVQLVVLALMIRESDNARCLSNEACPTGTWCGGASASTPVGGAGASGSCFDCYYVEINPAWVKEHAPADLEPARAYCAKHDRPIRVKGLGYRDLARRLTKAHSWAHYAKSKKLID